MNPKPIASVIMPLFNKRPYVRRAIESVQMQTFKDWELIIIDDGSTDDSLSEVPADDLRIHVVSQDNAGPSAARNRGVKLARGEFIFFLDADDLYFPKMLEQSISLLENEKKMQWVVTACQTKDGGNISNHSIKNGAGKNLIKGVSIVKNAPKQLKLVGIPPTGLCVRTGMMSSVGGFNEFMHCFEIAEFVIRCALAQPKLIVNNQVLFRVVKVPNSASAFSEHRLIGRKEFGISLLRLSHIYPEFSSYLIHWSRTLFCRYAIELIALGKYRDARNFLYKQFPKNINAKIVVLLLMVSLPPSIQREFIIFYNKLKNRNVESRLNGD